MLQEVLGMPFEVAITIVILNGFLYCWHAHLGDPVVPGWITPAIPLLVAYVKAFPEGVPRMHALISFELTLGIFAFVLGVTGMAKRFVDAIPNAIKAGVLIGAGIAAVTMIFRPDDGRFWKSPITISICLGLAVFLLFSNMYKSIRHRHKILTVISDLGIMPSILVATIIGPLFEPSAIPFPHLQWGFTVPHVVELFTQWTPWSPRIGWPSVGMFLSAIPLVVAVYIVLFGELIQAQALIEESSHFRPDEKVDFNPNRNNIIVGLRNMIMSTFGPDISMCGPMWAAMQVVETDRYKHGREAMDSLIGGVASFRLGTFTGYWLSPIVTFVKPILNTALSLTLLIQGFVAVRIGVLKARSYNDLGIAGIVAGVLAVKGAAWAFGVGIIMCLLIYGRNFFAEQPVKASEQVPPHNIYCD
ncbi:hypothetical protein [Desulfofundulus thermobenzoicus]|uniref:hypothetical protein n=1 Tax=Desulfofundulus thermobenzoicus TaxID=29376 RepID=UPI001FAA513E|nr:hypothetical protein [Desulfofundulus thermobenzoicus]